MLNATQILSRFANEPALVEPSCQAWFEACLHGATQVMARIDAATDQPQMADQFWYPADDWRSAYRPYVVRDGILQIPVKGVLLNDYPWSMGKWATGYEYIWKAFERGQGDPEVKGVALVCDTPGGMVAGNFDLVDKMHEWPDRKPLWAFAHESAYSAGYSIASVADKIYVSRSGGVGSIGVVTSHTDVSKLMDDIGYKITFIFAGKHKVDGNPYEALPADVKARIQGRIDALYDVFVSTVARNRGLEEQAVRDTEALTFTATEATSNGLADAVGTLDDALAAFVADLTPHTEEEQMSEQDNNPKVVDQATFDAAVADARAAGVTEGAAAERTRINAILACDAAAERPKAALSAALKTDMTVDQAAAFLGDLSVEAPPVAAAVAEPVAGAPAGLFDAAMSGTDNPNVGTGNADTDAQSSGQDDIALARSFGLGGVRAAAR